jgi:hypothetical protein
MAQCATSDLRVRCVYVGPQAAEQDRSTLGARFVTATRKSVRDQPGSAIRRRSVPPIVAGVAAHHILEKGDTLPDDVLILMNPLRYGLPRPQDGWTYFKAGDAIYRAELQTRRVLNYINPHINRY